MVFRRRRSQPRYQYQDDFPSYVPAQERRARAARELEALRRSTGRDVTPVVIEGRAIARTFWGKAWCDNLERYSDFENRLPRGRSYVRSGAVVDLQIVPGAVTAAVSGTDLYAVTVKVTAVPPRVWRAICDDCSGKIDSVVTLLQGHLSPAVMSRLCQEGTGLFPRPREIAFTCSCPDRASMCKHVAAVLYGVGARLDDQPQLLFTLRQVDERDMITRAGEALGGRGPTHASRRLPEGEDLTALFGIEIVQPPERAPLPARAGRVSERPPRGSSSPRHARSSRKA
jgi:uncharacterized Zn finger protein